MKLKITIQFYKNILHSTNSFAHSTSSLVFQENKMAGLNPNIVNAAARTAIQAQTQTTIGLNISVFSG
jgi:hypothetical protein